MGESISEWTRRQRELLRLERDEERSQVADTIKELPEQECIERGISLVPVAVQGMSTGLYGRTCLSVGDPKGKPLPAHRLSAGDEVRLYSTKGSKNRDKSERVSEITGVIGKVTDMTIEVVGDEADEAGSLRAPLRLDVIASEATHKKLMLGLDALEKYRGGGPADRLINVLFGSVMPTASGSKGRISPPLPKSPSTAGLPATSRLNESQREAVVFALATHDVALIHGPPGTGKTTTVVALIREAVARGLRCLVCAPSNVAVDGILEKLLAAEAVGGGVTGVDDTKARGRPRLVRLGHPARLLPQVVEHSLDALVSRHEGTAIVKDVRKEIDELVFRLYPEAEAMTGPTPKLRGADRKSAQREMKALRKEARMREDKVVKEILRSRDVVLATCVGAATHSLRDEEFDLLIIDEAAQALEAACWIPILKGTRLVLAGDHKQLAPTVKSSRAQAGVLSSPFEGDSKGKDSTCATDGLGLTMFDRVLRDLGQDVCRMLDVQYRMNQDICDWASREMYGGRLRADMAVASRSLPGLPHASSAQDMTAAIMLLLDTTGCDMQEEAAGGGSRRNEREAEVAVQHVKNLLRAGLREHEIALISPYNGQVNLLKRLLRPEHAGVEVRSVDGFQGGEKEAIVMSLVRSNPGRQVGFLADARRLNVAVTRAKRHVAIVCDAECCGSDAFIGRLLRHVEERGEYRSALELCREVESNDTIAAEHEQGDGTSFIASLGGAQQEPDSRPHARTPASAPKISDKDILASVHDFARALREPSAAAGTCTIADGPTKATGGNDASALLSELQLPTTLTARQRALVHETAERLGIAHISLGEGATRTLTLSRKKSEPEPAKTTNAAVGGDENAFFKGEDTSEIPESISPEADLRLITASSDIDAPRESIAPSSTSGEARIAREAPPKEMGRAVMEQDDVDREAVARPRLANEGIDRNLTTTPFSSSAGAGGANALLASLHAERAARQPPAPPFKGGKARTRRKPGTHTMTGTNHAAGAAADDRGFTIDVPGHVGRSGGAGGGNKKKKGPKKGASNDKGSEQAERRRGAGAPERSKVSRTAASRPPSSAADAVGCAGVGGQPLDDDLAFLDAQIKAQRAAEPCYAPLLRSTSEAMRANNPNWAASQDKRKPSRSQLTTARRSKLEGALQSRLAEEEKKRQRASRKPDEA